MLTIRGFSLAEPLLLLSLLGVMVSGWNVFFFESYDFSGPVTFFLGFICGLLTFVSAGALITLIDRHARILRALLITLFVRDLAEREDDVLQDLKKPLLTALGAKNLATGLDLEVVLDLKRSSRLALKPQSRFWGARTQPGHFTPGEIALLEDALRRSFQDHMGPRLAPLAIYLWPDRRITIKMKSPSRHQVISSLGKAQVA